MKALSNIESVILMATIAMVSNAITGTYLKLFNLTPPISSYFINLPIILAMIFVIVLRFRDTVFGGMISIPSLLFAGFALVSFQWSMNPALTFREGMLGLVIVLYFGCIAWSYSWDRIVHFVWLSMFAMAIISLCLFFVVPSLGKMSEIFPGALMGLWLEKNTAGQIGAFGAMLAIARFAQDPTKLPSFLISFCVFSVLLLLSTSKTALVAFLLGCALCGWVFMARRHVVITIPAIWLTVFIGLFSLYYIIMQQEAILGLLGRNATFTGRADIWKAIQVSLVDRPWFGHGYGAYWSKDYMDSTVVWVLEDLKYFPSHAHNAWFETGLGLGKFGQILLTMVFAMAAVFSLIRVRSSNGAYFAVPFIISAGIVSLFESTLAYPNNFCGAMMFLVAAKSVRLPMANEKSSGLRVVRRALSAYRVKPQPVLPAQ